MWRKLREWHQPALAYLHAYFWHIFIHRKIIQKGLSRQKTWLLQEVLQLTGHFHTEEKDEGGLYYKPGEDVRKRLSYKENTTKGPLWSGFNICSSFILPFIQLHTCQLSLVSSNAVPCAWSNCPSYFYLVNAQLSPQSPPLVTPPYLLHCHKEVLQTEWLNQQKWVIS